MDIGRSKKGENNNKEIIIDDKKVNKKSFEKSYFDVLGLCCSSEVPLIEKLLNPLEGVIEVRVIVPSRTVIVLHDPLLISQQDIVKALNQARLEANVRAIGKDNFSGKWPSPFVILSGVLLAFSLLQYVYQPLQWLAVAAVAVGVWPILLRATIAIKSFTLDVHVLMLIAVVGTLVLRDYLEAGTIVFLFTIAEWLESRASQKATAVMSSLLSMTPQQATIAETGEVVNVRDVKLNTTLAVKAGELIPIDGIVVEGNCEVDEKTLTGESFPVPKQIDSIVWAGTVNINGYVSVKTTALAEDCAVAKMATLVEEAQNNKSSVQRLIDKCAKFYTPAVVLISAGLAVVPAVMKVHNRNHWFYLSLVVLVSGCPCGLILSTPVATFCALSKAATSGLLIKGGDYLELLAKVKNMAFDKTGTLTRGEFTLKDFRSLADDVTSATLLYWVSSIESKSSHPIANVLVDYGRSHCIEPKPENVEAFQNFPGEGVYGKVDGIEIFIGNQKLGQRANCTLASNVIHDDDRTKEARTCAYIYSRGSVIGTFSLSDDCRTGASEAITELKRMGVRTVMLTGDSRATAYRAQEQLEEALDSIHAELLPEDKAKIITDYKKHGPTAMVGDGVNDAPALATADVGISMGVSGSALATETGHVVLMSNDIRKIPQAIKLARKSRITVIQNISISIITKAAVLVAAFMGRPLVWLAVLVDVATCLTVIGNSMLLLRASGHNHNHKTKCCSKTTGTTKCSSPCQKKTRSESSGATRCSSQKCQTSNPKPENSQQCCTTVCKVEERSEVLDCCQTTVAHSRWCTSECGSNDPHSPHTCGSDYLDLLESQASPCNKHAPSKLEHHNHHEHDHNDSMTTHHQCEQKSSCCESDDENKVKSQGDQEEITTYRHQCSVSAISAPHDDKIKELKHEHCMRSPEGHHHHQHAHEVAKHACNSWKKREIGACCRSFRKKCCSAQGQIAPAFGGLTEIVTE